jgi:hypothetical protein
VSADLSDNLSERLDLIAKAGKLRQDGLHLT